MPTEALVTTDWVAEHLSDPDVKIAEVDEDASAYERNHIPGAIGFDWRADFQDGLIRNFLDRERFGQLLASRGIGRGIRPAGGIRARTARGNRQRIT